MASTNTSPIISHILILLVAMLNICILSYDAGMINNLNKVQPYFECVSDQLNLVFFADILGRFQPQ